MTNEEEVPLDRQGIIPGPAETEDQQCLRYASLSDFSSLVEKGFAAGEPLVVEESRFTSEERIPAEVMASSQAPATRSYDFTLSCVPGFYSDRGLGHFFGGMAMCFTEEAPPPSACGRREEDQASGSAKEKSPGRPKMIYLFQLREAFRKKARFLIYGREELVSHEACHIARMGLMAERYEEMLAYRISESRFRRYAGPIFSSTRQIPLFLLMLLIFFSAQVVGIFFGQTPWLWLGRAPFLLMLLWWIIRNHANHGRFNRALSNLEKIFGEKKEAAAFRLTDGEITALGLEGLSAAEVERTLFSGLTPLRKQMLQRYLLAEDNAV